VERGVGFSTRAAHWDSAYRTRGANGVSWFEDVPDQSLALLHLLGVDRTTPVVDVGGGASLLVDHLVAEGFADVTVLDVSDVALGEGRRRLGAGAPVTWLEQDLLEWHPARRYGLWHDRAVLHFLTTDAERADYLAVLRHAVVPGGAVVIATFAEDGPEQCSGLPVVRYSCDELADLLGPQFTVAATRRQVHTTPAATQQPFSWVAGRLADDAGPEVLTLGLGSRR